MRATCLCIVPDYEHDGDIRHEMSLINKVDPSAKLLDHWETKEDPEADCETCEMEVEFDYDKLSELESQFDIYNINKITEDFDAIVYATRTGSTYSYARKGHYTIAITLKAAIDRGLRLSNVAWAQKNWQPKR